LHIAQRAPTVLGMSETRSEFPTLPLQHSYAKLPDRFWQRVRPTPVSAPRVLAMNTALADELGIAQQMQSPTTVAMLAGNLVPPEADPIAMAYAGHQFGNFVPQLGDGRAILLGELIDRDGRRRDLQLKGAGPTAFSRGGDGRAAIGPVLREFLVSEAMHAMGVPTTRALAAVATGDHVWRERPVPGAVLTRVAASHLRVGTFQYFAARQDVDGVRTLVDYAIAHHYPELAASPNSALALLQAVGERQAALIAQWMLVGFIHGVMNTDNSTISGETIDYGPCAFLDEYDPAKVFSSIDRGGRYAFANQPILGAWNLARLAECLLPLIHDDGESAVAAASAVIDMFPEQFQQHWLSGMRAKLGLTSIEPADEALANELLAAMHAVEADYTSVFRALSARVPDGDASREEAFALPKTPAFDAWIANWRARCSRDSLTPSQRVVLMKSTNPAVIPRNHQVERALVAAEHGDLSVFNALLDAVRRPYDDGPSITEFMRPPEPSQRVVATFCGT
jgi:uncharacterized protein YdiU (UPF0061 family)